jgi:integrase
MRIYKPKYRDKQGQVRTVGRWSIEIRDHQNRARRFVGFTDKAATESLGKQIQRLISCRASGEPISPELSRWLERIPGKLRTRFGLIGLLDPERAGAGKLLTEHLSDFRAALQAKGNTPSYVELTVRRIKRVFGGCKFFVWTDLSASRVEKYLADLHNDGAGISRQTGNYYLQAVKQFARWMVQDRRALESPVQHLKGLNTRTDRRHDRRALSPDEIRRLLEATTAEPERFGMTGTGRALLYRAAIETGLRANELRSLKVSSFDFDNCTVVVEAAYSKHRRRDQLPLRPDTANELRAFVRGKLPMATVFAMPNRWRVVKMLRADLGAAGIAYRDEAGRYADFHALRHTTGTLLAAAGLITAEPTITEGSCNRDGRRKSVTYQGAYQGASERTT